MKKRPSTFINMLASLSLVTLAAALSLGFVYELTKAPIAQAQLERQLAAIRHVLPGFDNQPLNEALRAEGSEIVCYPVSEQGRLKGFAVKTRSTNGYSGPIWLMVGLEPSGKITDIRVLDHRETPGLGTKMAEEPFLKQFRELMPQPLKVKKDGGQIDAISGATISSRAFCEAVEQAWAMLPDLTSEPEN